MTNGEAKIFLQSRIELIDKYYPQVEDYREALEIAIKALGSWDKYSTELWQAAYERGKKEGENEKCEDCISRTEALRLIDEERQHLLRLNMDGAEHIIVHHARRIIEDMPSVTPQPKRGKWIKRDSWSVGCGMGEKYGYYYECSECGKQVKGGYPECNYNYCPNCGSYNGGEEDV